MIIRLKKSYLNYIIFQRSAYNLNTLDFKLFEWNEFLPGIFVKKSIFNIILNIVNKFDNIFIYSNENLVFSNHRNYYYKSYYDYQNFFEYNEFELIDLGVQNVEVDKIIYPRYMGGNSTRCSIQNIFKDNFGLDGYSDYIFSDILDMCEASTYDKDILRLCKNSSSCSYKIANFKDSKAYRLNLIKFNDKYFLRSDGAHRICIVKKTNIKFIKAKVSEVKKLKEKDLSNKSDIYEDLYFESNSYSHEVLKDFYCTMNKFGFTKEEALNLISSNISLYHLIDKMSYEIKKLIIK